MTTIPIELDKMFAAVPAKPVATESLAEQTGSFRRHLEQRRPASETSSATAPSAGNPRAPDNGGADSVNANEKLFERTTDSSAESEKDQPAANNGGDATVVAAAVASQPVVDADHAEEAEAELKTDAESVVLPGEKARAGTSSNGAATAKSLTTRQIRDEATAASAPYESSAAAAQGDGIATNAVAANAVAAKTAAVEVTLANSNDGHQTTATAAQTRAAKESQEKGKAAARTKPGGDKLEQSNEHAAAQAASDVKSQQPDDETPQDRLHADGRLLPRVPDVSHSEPATKTHSPEPTSVARDGAVDVLATDQSATRDAAGNAASQNSLATPNVTDVTTALRLPSHLVNRGAEHAASGVHLTEAEQAKFLQRVARAFQAAQERDGEVRLRLSPPELGSLRVEIKIHEGALTARLEAESPAAKALLLDNLPVLRERLAEQGIRIEHFDVDLLDRQTGGSPQNSPQGHERDSPPAVLPSPLVRKSSETETDEPAPRTPIRRLGGGQLNVIV